MNAVPFHLGTRRSSLAIAQSKFIQSLMAERGVPCELVEIESKGDKDQATPLYEIESDSPGLFTKQLESALLGGEIDLAVHSLKDLPTDQPPGLRVACIPMREEARDSLLVSSRAYLPRAVLNLVEKAQVGTSSLRREALLLDARADLVVMPIRGNVPTRIRALTEGKVDAVILAKAGLVRLGIDCGKSGELVEIPLPSEDFVPAPGQGALAIETRVEVPAALERCLNSIHDPVSETETRIERRVLKGLHGGCTLPLGVRCQWDGRNINLQAFLGVFRQVDGKRRWEHFRRFDISGVGEDTLVAQAIAYFKKDIDASR